MSEEKMSCFYELINGFEIVGTLTDDGRKLIKEGVLHLYQENQRLNADLIKEEASYINLRDTYNKKSEKCNLYKEVIEEVREWLKYKAEALDEFDIPKRKETGAFWFSTRGEIDNLLQILDKVKENK